MGVWKSILLKSFPSLLQASFRGTHYSCPTCNAMMKLTSQNESTDGFCWQCRLDVYPNWLPKFEATIMLSFGSIVWLIVVAAIWGLSTPLIRHGSAGIENISANNPLSQWFAELQFLATNWKYVFPFLINQSGSALYTLALASADLSLAVPLTNSLTFIFVSISGRLLGETEGKSVSYTGMTLVAAGVTICVLENALK